MKTYHGYSDATDTRGPVIVVVAEDGGPWRPLKHEARHSPDGFEWGYAGSGPADLARSILADHLGYVPHPSLYQAFKFAYVQYWSQGGAWRITSDEIQQWLNT